MTRIILLILFTLSLHTAVAQRATKIEKVGEDRWVATIPIAPKGQNGPYIPNFKVTIDLITVNSGDDSGADAVGVGLRFATGGVVKYRYQGVDYVDDANMKLEVGVCTGFYEFSYRITVANAGSISASSKDFAKIPIGKKLVYKEVEALRKKLAITSFEITDYELVQSDLDYIGRRVGEKKESAGQQVQSNTQTATNQTFGSSVHTQGTAPKSQYKDPLQEIDNYIATEKRNRESLEKATDETTSQWAQGNYIQGSQALSYEYARQGNATGTYGTIATGVAMQTASIIGDISAARQAKKAEEAAYVFEYDQGAKALIEGNYQQAYNYFLDSYQKGKFKEESEIMLGSLLLEGRDGVKQDIPAALSIFRKYITPNGKMEKKQKNYGQLAYYFLGRAYFEGIGVPQDFYKADEMFYLSQTSTNYDNPLRKTGYYAQLTSIYQDALRLFIFPTKDEEKIKSIISRLNYEYTSGAIVAIKQYVLGMAYLKGATVEKSEEKAFKHFIASARKGSFRAFQTAKQNFLIPSHKDYAKRNKKLNNAYKLGVKINKYYKEQGLNEIDDSIIDDIFRTFKIN